MSRSGCRNCNLDDPYCTCKCHSIVTPDDMEMGLTGCDKEEYD